MKRKHLKAALLFYKQYCIISLLLSLVCCGLFATSGEQHFVSYILMKMVMNAGVLYFINFLGKDGLYYYYNLHISKTSLFLFYLITDLAVLTGLLWTITIFL